MWPERTEESRAARESRARGHLGRKKEQEQEQEKEQELEKEIEKEKDYASER